jgi:hypothetical protein
MGRGGVEWIPAAQDKGHWWTSVTATMNLRFQKIGIFLTEPLLPYRKEL